MNKSGETPSRVTFGIIVLNGEPFTAYCLRALYPFAHQIVVCEGAVPKAAAIARPDGHSTDGTLERLRRFQKEEDPERKVIVVTAEEEGHPNGFWPGEKDEMSLAYARRATGNYLWQVDVDEFYQPEDMASVLAQLDATPSLHAVSFPMTTFWGGFDYVADGWYLRRGAGEFHRLFRWGPGYRYVTHRPPTVQDPNGRELREQGWLRAGDRRNRHRRLYHYSLLFPKQVIEKCTYHAAHAFFDRDEAVEWAKEDYLRLRRPFRVHNVYQFPSWLSRFRRAHPPEIERLRRDIKAGIVAIALRPTEDIERLLRKPLYALGRECLKLIDRWGKSSAYAQRLARRISR